MDKVKLGKLLRELREKSKAVCGMSEYAARSIELGRSSYPVKNLILYLKDFGAYLMITDLTLGERYRADTLEDVHNIIALLMKHWNVEQTNLYAKIGVHYTPPQYSKGKNSLSIDTLLKITDYFHCELTYGLD